MSFLPPNYEAPVANSNYMRLQKGDNKFRFLTSPIIGYEFWTEEEGKRKPNRVRTIQELPTAFKSDFKFFWAAVVLDYTTGAIKILEITQRTIQAAIEDMCASEDWGTPLDYDLTVKRTGEALDTEYSVIPSPKKPVDTELVKEANKINLEALYEGKDPWENV